MTRRLIRRPDRPRRRAAIRCIAPAALLDTAGSDTASDPAGVADLAGISPTAPSGRGKAAGFTPSMAMPGRFSSSALLAFARETYNVRCRRGRFLPADLFGEPTWDILLDLYVATRENRPVPTTSACIGAHVPPTTALRWLRILETRGLVERQEDERDGRRTFVRLSEQGLASMDDWLHAALLTLYQTVGVIIRHSSGAIVGQMAEAAE